MIYVTFYWVAGECRLPNGPLSTSKRKKCVSRVSEADSDFASVIFLFMRFFSKMPSAYTGHFHLTTSGIRFRHSQLPTERGRCFSSRRMWPDGLNWRRTWFKMKRQPLRQIWGEILDGKASQVQETTSQMPGFQLCSVDIKLRRVYIDSHFVAFMLMPRQFRQRVCKT